MDLDYLHLSMTAPSLKSISAVLSCPSAQAKCSAVFPWLFSKLMILTCWFSISASTQSVQPYLQDKFMRLTFSIHRQGSSYLYVSTQVRTGKMSTKKVNETPEIK